MMSDDNLLGEFMPKYYARDDSVKLPQDLHKKVNFIKLSFFLINFTALHL